MGQILIRNVDDEVHARLKAQAADADKSLEQYVRDVLAREVQPTKEKLLAKAQEIRSRSKRTMTADEYQAFIDEMKAERDARHDFLLPDNAD